MIIYKATNKINGKVYIGQTIQKFSDRIRAHKNNKSNSHFHNAIRKYGIENFTWGIICRADTKEKLNVLERFYIACYRKLTPECYNIADGGGGVSGHTWTTTEEHKQKVSRANKGKKISIESKKKMSIAKKDKYKNENHPQYKHSLKTEEIVSLVNQGYEYKEISILLNANISIISKRMKKFRDAKGLKVKPGRHTVVNIDNLIEYKNNGYTQKELCYIFNKSYSCLYRKLQIIGCKNGTKQ